MVKAPSNLSLNIPQQMRGVVISAPGGPEVLRLKDVPTPRPGTGEVLIKVAAAGVNRPDCLQRRGIYPPPPGASELPGLEVAGTIVQCGDGVESLQSGDRVCALVAGGGYAEYCLAPAVQCLPVPTSLTLAQAATLPETFFTVWSNVFDRGKLVANETLLVHGGASGIGTTAIQMGRAMGATVYATAGSDAKAKLCEALGAARCINYKRENFLDELKAETSGGVDVILDIVGGSHLEQNIKLLNTDGRLVVIGILGGAKGTLNLGLVLSKRLVITGSTLRARPPAEKQLIADQLRKHIWPLLEHGTIKPVVQRHFGLADAAEAHRLLEANQAEGKLVLMVNADHE